MPSAPRSPCQEPRCPYLAFHRGRCAVHRQTTTQRGYGAGHQQERAAALPGARCGRCGCTVNLHRDHRVPRSLGGIEHPSNKRWLCDCVEHRCHSRFGVKSTSRRGAGQNYGRSPASLTLAQRYTLPRLRSDA